MCAMRHCPHGSERAGLLAMDEISRVTDCFLQFVKLIIVIGVISHTGEIPVTVEIQAIGVISVTGMIIQDKKGP